MKKAVKKTVDAAIMEMFNQEVVHDCKKVKMKDTTTLYDYSLDAKFKNEWADMLIDRIDRVFGISSKRFKNKPVVEIIKFIVASKRKFNSLPPSMQIYLQNKRK